MYNTLCVTLTCRVVGRTSSAKGRSVRACSGSLTWSFSPGLWLCPTCSFRLTGYRIKDKKDNWFQFYFYLWLLVQSSDHSVVIIFVELQEILSHWRKFSENNVIFYLCMAAVLPFRKHSIWCARLAISYNTYNERLKIYLNIPNYSCGLFTVLLCTILFSYMTLHRPLDTFL